MNERTGQKVHFCSSTRRDLCPVSLLQESLPDWEVSTVKNVPVEVKLCTSIEREEPRLRTCDSGTWLREYRTNSTFFLRTQGQ